MIKINKNPNNDLIASYMNGNFDLFSQLIKDGENINCLDIYNNSLISLVIENPNKLKNNKKFFNLLISNGVCLKQIGWEYDLLTQCLIYQKDLYYARKLLKNKININAIGVCRKFDDKYNDDFTDVCYGPPIFEALKMGDMKYFNLFLNNNADVEIIDNNGNSILHVLINKKDEEYQKYNQKIEKEIFENLLNRGADPHIRCNDGKDVLHSLICNEKDYLIRSLFKIIKNINVNTRNNKSQTPLMKSICNDMPNIVKFLIKKKANIGAYDIYDNNALVFCVKYDNLEMFKFLIEKGMDINSVDRWGATILHQIAYIHSYWENRREYIEIILEKKPELLLQKSDSKETPLSIFKKDCMYERGDKRLYNKIINKIKNKSKMKKSNKISC